MTIVEKLEKITSWYAARANDQVRQLVRTKDTSKITSIERMLGTKLPDEFVELYTQYDGETGRGIGSFMGHCLVSLDEIISNIEFSKTLVKPKDRVITNQKEADRVIELIIKEYKKNIPKETHEGVPITQWHKFEFECSPNSLDHASLFLTDKKDKNYPELVSPSAESQNRIFEFARQLHSLERESYNWDAIVLTVYGDGTQEVKRKDYNFDETIPFTSFPRNAIKKKYFHTKWVPVISDSSGNYIGIDLDPDVAGHKGQVINFGRDEENMFVMAESLNQFFEFNLDQIASGGGELLDGTHIHDVYKQIIVPLAER